MEIVNNIQHNLPLYARVVSFVATQPSYLLGAIGTTGNPKEQ